METEKRLVLEFRKNQAEAKKNHYDSCDRIDARSGWICAMTLVNTVLLLVLLLKLFIFE
jgi:hypothetical protein